MPSSTVKVPNPLSKQEALQRIQGMLAGLQEKGGDQITDLQETWTQDGGSYSFKVRGHEVSGVLKVGEDEVEIDLSYPMAARPFKGKIESMLRDRTEALLAA